jgi:hypothetical protein
MNFLDLVPLAGYLFAVDEEAVAAAMTNARDRLIFRKSVSSSDRSLIAAAAFSLLLFEPQSDPNIEAPVETGGFSFTLVEDQTEIWRVACRGTGRSWWQEANDNTVLRMMTPTATVMSIECDLVSVRTHQHKTFEMATSTDRRAVAKKSGGRITGAKDVYDVRPSYVEGLLGSVPLAGYLFVLEEEPVAAVTTHPMGQLIVRNSVAPEEQSLIAAAGFVLIILTPAGVK